MAAPVASLFGYKLAAIEFSNLIVYALSAILFLVLLAKLYGLRITLLGLLLFSATPDLFYPITLASYDIHGVFGLLAFVLLATSLDQNLSKSMLPKSSLTCSLSGTLVLGFQLTALNYSRSYGLMANVGLLILAGALVIEQSSGAQRKWKVYLAPAVLLVLIPLLVQDIAQKALDDTFLRPRLLAHTQNWD